MYSGNVEDDEGNDDYGMQYKVLIAEVIEHDNHYMAFCLSAAIY